MLFLAACVWALTGCQGIDMSSPQLRVIDASPDAGLIDAYQNNTAIAYNLGFGTATSYVPMAPGAYVIGADRAGTRQALAAGSANLIAGKRYTAIVGNVVASLQETILQDKSQPAAAGEVEFRFVHQAIRSGAVDVYLVPRSGRLSSTAPIAVSLGFGANTGYLSAPAGAYSIAVVPAGTVLVPSTTTLLSGAQSEYASGAVRTVLLIDQEVLGAQRAALSPGVHPIIAVDADSY